MIETLTARNGEVRLAYELRGDGPPLLLIHGLGYDRRGWGPLPDLLADRFRVALFDNRGLGESDAPEGPYTAAEMAVDAAAVLDAAGIERTHVVGDSLGGMIAQEFALAFPERVDRLVLACTTPGGGRAYPMPARTVSLLMEFPTLPLEIGLRKLVENALADETVRTRPELVEEIYRYRLDNQPPLGGWQAQAAAGLSYDAWTRISQIAAPTLVVTGTADNVVDQRNSELLASRIPNARLEHFSGGGHLFFWEEPERFAKIVGDFLEEGR